MRNGLLALSVAMLGGGGIAAQSALAISLEATAAVASGPSVAVAASGQSGSLHLAQR